jgi:hypothetical protein
MPPKNHKRRTQMGTAGLSVRIDYQIYHALKAELKHRHIYLTHWIEEQAQAWLHDINQRTGSEHNHE